ncbi:unnamed protein product [Urochloa decumbens]|uniref:F-box protein n=1 Tax=Urochloa decumbens TaxID=240449 RepID=A0ABC8YMD8_9POAL
MHFSFSRPSTGPSISGQMHYLPSSADGYIYISGHCNGLLLLDLDGHGDHVVNPATRAWSPVPPPPAFGDDGVPRIFYYQNYLVFDPTLSPYHEVISFPHIKFHCNLSSYPPAVAEAEWPPSTCIFRVFSSRTNRWEERSFVREGEAQATILDMRRASVERPYSTYSRGALYAFCRGDFVIRISMSHNKYRAIKPPVSFDNIIEIYLGKSEKGVYLASYDYRDDLVQIWMLDESCGRMEWMLKHNCDLKYVLRQNCCQQAGGPWVLHDVNYNFYRHLFPNNIKEAPIEKKYEWDSDNDDVLGNENRAERHHCGIFYILGFHPFKEVIFFSQSEERGIAYHWNSSKIQDLGNMYPIEYEYFSQMCPDIGVAFPYTPCWT